jgi:NADPH-dependent 2,4-dienoyl-CoA reductase/sulfur reductase-like enzyme
MPNDEQTDVLVLGGGPAGIQGSRTIKTRRPDWNVTMLRPEPASMVYCAIPYALEGLIPRERALKKDSLVTEAGIELFREQAEEIDLAKRWVRIASGRKIQYERLLIATGADPFVPPVEGARLARVETMKTQRDMDRVLGYLEAGAQRAVVVGAGAIGIEQALAYRRRGLEVDLVDLQDRILPHLTDADMSEPAAEMLVEEGIRLHLRTKIAGFAGERAVAGVELSDGTSLRLEEGRDFAVLAIGMRPNVSLFEGQLELARDGIVVDEKMSTGVEGTFAAGDCTQCISGIDGRPLGGKLATNAVPQAKVAALNLLGEPARYPGIFNGAATVVGELRIGGTGFTETYARTRGFEPVVSFGESTSRFPMMPGARPVRVKLVADARSGRLIGGQVRGYEAVAERIDVITLAIQHGLTGADLAGLSYSAQPWQTFFPAKNAIVEAAAGLPPVAAPTPA